jgi:thiol-disulfide isomerase/thioredoxin
VSVQAGILVAALAVGLAVALWRRRRDGRVREVTSSDKGARVMTATDLGTELGDRATLVQFSTEVCAVCPATRRILGSIAADTPGIVFTEIKAESAIDLVRRFDVRRSPTILILDTHGVERHRASGLVKDQDVRSALEALD